MAKHKQLARLDQVVPGVRANPLDREAQVGREALRDPVYRTVQEALEGPGALSLFL